MLCATVLAITVIEKFQDGGWLTLAVTGAVVALCFVVRRHYRRVGAALSALYAQRAETDRMLERYVELAHGLGLAATFRFAIGTDAGEQAEKLCLKVVRDFPRTTVFAGKVIFERERWYQCLLHNETAFAIQKRLQFAGQTIVILPAKLA